MVQVFASAAPGTLASLLYASLFPMANNVQLPLQSIGIVPRHAFMVVCHIAIGKPILPILQLATSGKQVGNVNAEKRLLSNCQ